MVLPLYLALTAGEFTACSPFPEYPAWMACHFSPYGTGLTNLPPALPEGCLLILNDRTPIRGHDPKCILGQLKALKFSALLLDLQRPGNAETAALVQTLTKGLHRPVGVSEPYAGDGDGPVFLPPVPPDVPVETYLAPWQGREIWLEAALSALTYTVTEKGSTAAPLPAPPLRGLRDEALSCHYHLTIADDRAEFQLFRTPQDLTALLDQAQTHGVTRAIGLWQELRGKL